MRITTTKDTTKDKNKKKLVLSFFKSKISDNENLFENGKLDSLRVIELISFIERKTNKKITKSYNWTWKRKERNRFKEMK